MSFETVLPLYLYEIVLDQIDDTERSTLVNCSLTCHAFHSICRKKLFATIEFWLDLEETDPEVIQARLQRFYDILLSSSGQNLASYSQKLTIHDLRTPRKSHPLSQPPGFRQQCSILSSIIPFFHNIHDFCLDSGEWHRFPSNLKRTLIDCFLSNPITHLRINCVERLQIRLLNCFSHLKELTIIPGSFSQKTSHVPRDFHKGKTRLDMLNIGGSNWQRDSTLIARTLVEWIIKDPSSRLDISKVKGLVWRDKVFHGLVRISNFSATLQSLVVESGMRY